MPDITPPEPEEIETDIEDTGMVWLVVAGVVFWFLTQRETEVRL